MSEPMNNVDQSSLIRDLAQAAVHEVPDSSWQSITYRVSSLIGVSEDNLYVVDSTGQSTAQFATMQLSDIADQLRVAMYRPAAGTWFSATITIERSGSVDADFNYDDEPPWTAPVDPVDYRQDLERFPRDDSAVPEWLRERLS